MFRRTPIFLNCCLVATAAVPNGPNLEGLLEVEAFTTPADQMLRMGQALPAHPTFSVIQLLEENRFLYDETGCQTSVFHYVFRIDRETAIPGWGQLQAGWSPWLDDRPSIRARVITPDGHEHVLDPATLSDAQSHEETPEMFEDRRIVRGPLPMLQVGAVAEVEIRVHQHRPFAASGFRQTFPLAWQVPVYRSRLRVELPVGAPPKCQLYGLPDALLVRSKTHAMQRLQVDQELVMPPKAREPFQAFDEEPAPGLMVTNAPSWSKVVAEYMGLIEAHQNIPSLRAWVEEAMGHAESRDLKIQRILTRMQKQVRYIGLEFGESAIVPRAPEETLRRGYGDCKDQATLLVALLHQAGIEAHLVLLRAGESRDFSPAFPGLAAFNHAIVQVPGHPPLWIDPTVPQARVGQIPLGDAGRNALIIAHGTKAPVQIPGITSSDNCEVETREVFLAEDGPGRVVETTSAKGVAEVTLRARYQGADPERMRDKLKEYAKNVYGAKELGEVTLSPSLDFENPMQLRLEAKQTSNATTSAKNARITLNPWPMVALLNRDLQPGEEEAPSEGAAKGSPAPRRTSLELPYPWSGETTWILHAPDGYEADALPEPQTRTFGPATLHWDWKRTNEGTVEARFRFECNHRLWSPKEVDQARAALKAFGEETSPVIVLQNRGEALLEAGNMKGAIAEFRRQCAHNPKATDPLVRLANAQFSVGLAEQSKTTLLKAIALDPKAERPHRELGWVLEHDAIGRRFRGDWDRAGAAAELQKAMELAPELRMARLDLANLLGHDEHGGWSSPQDLKTVVQLYLDQLAKGKDELAQIQLTRALAQMENYVEAQSAANALETIRDRQGWTLALSACLKGGAFAIQEAKRTIQDPEIRQSGLQAAVDFLMLLRKYPEAGLIARECNGEAETSKYRLLADLAPRIKHYEDVPLDPRTPIGCLLSLVRATSQSGFDPNKVLPLLSPAQRPEKHDLVSLMEYTSDLHIFRICDRDWRLRQLDELHSSVDFGIEGTEKTGYRIKTAMSSLLPKTVYISCQAGICQVVGWSRQPWKLGKEALWQVKNGNIEGARSWLDRAISENVTLPNDSDPLSGHPFGQLWTKGQQGSEEEIKIAAALLILNYEKNDESRLIIENALKMATDPKIKGSLLRELYWPLMKDRKAAETYTSELLSLFPHNIKAIKLRANCLADDKRFEEALALIRSGRKENPFSELLLIAQFTTLHQMGRWDDAANILRQAIKEGMDSVTVLNTLAWKSVCTDHVTPEAEKWSNACLQQEKRPECYHTLACVQAKLGHITQAYDSVLKCAAVDEPITPGIWFAMGLLAQALDDPDAARMYFSRVDTQDNPDNPSDPTTCRAMARKGLASLAGPGH